MANQFGMSKDEWIRLEHVFRTKKVEVGEAVVKIKIAVHDIPDQLGPR